MDKLNKNAELSIGISILNTFFSKKIDNRLSVHGISFTEFMILYFLEYINDKMMRRIDLAEKIGLSASGITRLVLPMEKRGLVKKERNKRDARVSLVKITESGRTVLKDSVTTINEITKELFSSVTDKKCEELLKTITKMGINLK